MKTNESAESSTLAENSPIDSPADNDTGEGAPTQAPALPPIELTGGLDNSDRIELADITGLHVSTMPEFDPEIHAVDGNGNPRRRGNGELAKKRGRKAGQPPGAGAKPDASGRLPGREPSAGGASGASADPLQVEIEQAARTATNLTIGVSVAIFGQDFVPAKNEPEMLKGAFRDYFGERGVTKLPPEIALAAALAGYYIPRMSQPTVKTRALTIGVKIRDFFAKFKRKSKGDATPDDAKDE